MASYLQPLDSHPLRSRGEKRLHIAPNLIGLPGFRQAEDVVAFSAHLLREVPGRRAIIRDGALMHHRHAVKACLASGAMGVASISRISVSHSGRLAHESVERRAQSKPLL